MSAPATIAATEAPAHDRLAETGLALLGAGSGIYLHVGGQLYLSEIVLVALVPLVALGWNRAQRPWRDIRLVVLALLLWLAGLILGGLLIDSSTAATTLQYCADAAVTVVTVVVVHRLVRERAELIILLLGFGIGQLLVVLVQGNALTAVNAWKFGAGTGIVTIALCLRGRARSGQVVLAGAVLASLAFDTRSIALIAIAALALGITADVVGRTLRPAGLTAIFLVVLGGAATSVSLGYGYLVRHGVLGAAASVKYAAQGHGSPLLVLLGGRDEIFFSVRSIWTHPILGLGTNPTLSADAASAGLRQMASLGLQPAVPSVDQPGQPLPVHSYLFGGWAYAGVLGLACWVIIFVVIFRRTLRVALGDAENRYLVLFLGMFALWNILYSPYGATGRFQLAVTVVALVTVGRSDVGTRADNAGLRLPRR